MKKKPTKSSPERTWKATVKRSEGTNRPPRRKKTASLAKAQRLEETDIQQTIAIRVQELRREQPDISPHQLSQFVLRIYGDHHLLRDGEGENPAVNQLLHSTFFDSDRGAVLVAASIIDNLAGKLLVDFMKKRSDIEQGDINWWFEGPLAPFQSTSVKVKLCHALGMIDKQLRDIVLALQKVRSKMAAHSTEPFELTEGRVNDIFSKLEDSVTFRVATASYDPLNRMRLLKTMRQAAKVAGFSEARGLFAAEMTRVIGVFQGIQIKPSL